MEIRITYSNDAELSSLIDCISIKYKIVAISKPYKNRNSIEQRVYVNVECRGDI